MAFSTTIICCCRCSQFARVHLQRSATFLFMRHTMWKRTAVVPVWVMAGRGTTIATSADPLLLPATSSCLNVHATQNKPTDREAGSYSRDMINCVHVVATRGFRTPDYSATSRCSLPSSHNSSSQVVAQVTRLKSVLKHGD